MIPSSLTGNNLRSKYSANSIYTVYIISVFARKCMRVTKITIYETNLKQVLFYNALRGIPFELTKIRQS